MAKFCNKNLKLGTNEAIYFGDSDQAKLWFENDELNLNHTVSGVDPTQDYHLTTKGYVDDGIATLSGSMVLDHGGLTGLEDDDHLQYVPTDASRGFTATVSGVDPTQDYHLSTKKYVDDEITNNVITDHGALSGLSDDDHTQYILVDGTRAFTGVVGGVSPTSDNHLTTKAYVDSLVQGLDWQDSVLSKSYNDPATISGTPTTGDRYIIGTTASGVWVGNENSIATYNGSGWDVEAANEGFAAWVEDEDILYVYNGTGWVKFGATITHSNLLGLDQDDHPQYHNDARGDVRYYTKSQVDTISGTIVSQIPSLTGYATESYVDNHNWYEADILDLDKYTQAEVDTLISGVSSSIITDHGGLSGLSDDDHLQYVPTDASRGFTATVSGIDPTQDYHLATKWYIDNELATISGGIIQVHANLLGLDSDDHLQYVPTNASRGFTATVSGIDPTQDYHLTTKNYVDTVSGTIVSQIPSLAGYATESYVDNHNWYEADILDLDKYTQAEVDTLISGVSSSIITDHGGLTGLEDDDHTQYIPVDASRGFTATVSGIDPTQDYHLTTKNYVDTVSGTIVSQIPSLAGYATESYVDNHNWYEADILDLDKYTQAEVDTLISGVSSSIITDHGGLTGLTDDDHTQYIPVDASRGFTATVSGIDPTQDYHLTTKSYVDSVSVDKVKSGRTQLATNDSSKAITFGTAFADTNYTVSIILSNVVDSDPCIYPMIVSAKATTGFSVILSGEIDSNNYYIEWIARHD